MTVAVQNAIPAAASMPPATARTQSRHEARLAHVGHLIEHASPDSLWALLTVRHIARNNVPHSISLPRFALWLCDVLRDARGRPLLAAQNEHHLHYIAKHVWHALSAQPCEDGDFPEAVTAHIEQGLRRKLTRHVPSSTDLNSALSTLARGVDRHAQGVNCTDQDKQLRVFRERAGLAPQRSIAGSVTAFHVATRNLPPDDPPRPRPRERRRSRCGPVRPGIVSRLRPGDIRVVPASRQTRRRALPYLEITFPTRPVQVVKSALPAYLAHCFREAPSEPDEAQFDALRSTVDLLPECADLIQEDRRRAALYRQAAKRYQSRPPRPCKTPAWTATLVSWLYVIAPRRAPWAPPSPATSMPQDLRFLDASPSFYSNLAASDNAPGIAGARPDSPNQGLWPRVQQTWESMHTALERWTLLPLAQAETSTRTGAEAEAGAASDTDPAFLESADSDTDPVTISPAPDTVDTVVTLDTTLKTDPIHIHEWNSDADRDRIVQAAKTFALSDGTRPIGDDGLRFIKALNDEGWYSYSRLPEIFALSDRILTNCSNVNLSLFDNLIGLIALQGKGANAVSDVCFDGLADSSLHWHVNTTALPSPAGNTVHLKRTARTHRPGRSFSAYEQQLVLLSIMQLQLQLNDPPVMFYDLLRAMLLEKHDIELHPDRHVTAADARDSFRESVLLLLIRSNHREHPLKMTNTANATHPGPIKFVNFLIHSFDPVLSHAPDDTDYFGADMLRARLGDYFSIKRGLANARDRDWQSMVSEGDKHIDDWAILTFDEDYMAAMLKENEAFVRRMQRLFATNIARIAWLYENIRIGKLPIRSDIARQYLSNAGLNPDEHIVYRSYLTLGEARDSSSTVRTRGNQTFLDLYLGYNDGLIKLRGTEPAYANKLNDTVLELLPSRTQIIREFDDAAAEKITKRKQSYLKVLNQAYESLPGATRDIIEQSAQLKLHIYRPLQEETPRLQRQLDLLQIDRGTPLMRKITGFPHGGIIEAVDHQQHARYFLFSPERFATRNISEFLGPLPEVSNHAEAGRYLISYPDLFFTPRQAGRHEEHIYYKSDITSHLTLHCLNLQSLWSEWIELRLSYLSWRLDQLKGITYVEALQDDASDLYLSFLPMYSCWTLWNTETFTEDKLTDALFCTLDLSVVRYGMRTAKTWMTQSVGLTRMRSQLHQYEKIAMLPSIRSAGLLRKISDLRQTTTRLRMLRLKQSLSEAMEIPRALNPFPWARATGNTMAQIVQNVVTNTFTIASKGIPLRTPRVDSHQEMRLRLLSSTNFNEQVNRTLFGEISVLSSYRELSDQMRLSANRAAQRRLNRHFCIPRACVAVCRIEDFREMSSKTRGRIFLRLLKGMPLLRIKQLALEKGYGFSDIFMRKLAYMDEAFQAMRVVYKTLLSGDIKAFDDAEDIIWQALKRSDQFAPGTARHDAVKRLQSDRSFIQLDVVWQHLYWRYEPTINKMVAIVDEKQTPATVSPVMNNATAPAVSGDALLGAPPMAIERCDRPGMENEIRSCTLPISYCMGQRALEDADSAPESVPDNNRPPQEVSVTAAAAPSRD
jgi:hypothetical protein